LPAKKVLIMCGWHLDWINKSIMEIMRERYGTEFILVSASDRMESFREICSNNDRVISVKYEGLDFEQQPISGIQSDEIYKVARTNEYFYELSYLRDLIQQDRTEAVSFLNYAPGSVYANRQNRPLIEIYAYINKCFDYFNDFLKSENIDLIINRPGGLSDSVMIHIGLKLGIPTTFMHGSYYLSHATWTNGPYMGDDYFKRVYERTPETEPLSMNELAPSATWNPPPEQTLKSLLRTIFYQCLTYIQFWWNDFRSGVKKKRVSFIENLRSDIYRYKINKYVNALCETDMDIISSQQYIYVALPYEPEYTVQSLCKEFADVAAWIKHLALSLPAGFRLVLKEHQRIGNRSKEFYKFFQSFPNVIFAHPSLRGVDLISNCSATASMGGSTPAEAVQFGKPSIVFGTQNPYSFLPSVHVVTNPRDIASKLREILREYSNDEVYEIRKTGARFRKAYISASFDAANTVLFRAGSEYSISKEQVEKAVDILVESTDYQRERLSKKIKIGHSV
jgi:hypothetical protein